MIYVVAITKTWLKIFIFGGEILSNLMTLPFIEMIETLEEVGFQYKLPSPDNLEVLQIFCNTNSVLNVYFTQG